MAWYSETIEEFIKDMSVIGITLTEEQVKFTGFWSQGDGASFEFDARDCDNAVFLWFLFKSGLTLEGVVEMEELSTPEQDLFHDLTGSVSTRQWIHKYSEDLLIASERNESRYSHEKTCRIAIDIDSMDVSKSMDEQLDVIGRFAEEWRIGECKRLYRKLEKIYESCGDDYWDEIS